MSRRVFYDEFTDSSPLPVDRCAGREIIFSLNQEVSLSVEKGNRFTAGRLISESGSEGNAPQSVESLDSGSSAFHSVYGDNFIASLS
jgi:hypothetical protein